MLVVVLSGFVLALAAPLLHRLFRNRTGWLLAALPFSLFAYLTLFIKPIIDGRVFFSGYPWIPSLGIEISFYLDGADLPCHPPGATHPDHRAGCRVFIAAGLKGC